jgi:hypothetical protein
LKSYPSGKLPAFAEWLGSYVRTLSRSAYV